MTQPKPPMIFTASDFMLDPTNAKAAADKANEILSQRLKPWYAVESDGTEQMVVGRKRVSTDTHIIWGLDPIEIEKKPDRIKELEWLCDQHRITGLAKDAVISYYKDKL